MIGNREIRDLAYEQVVVSYDHTIDLCSLRRRKRLANNGHYNNFKLSYNFADILQTNKQIYDEARRIYYSQNQFNMGVGGNHYRSTTTVSMDVIKEFMKRIPKHQVARITEVSVEIFFVPPNSFELNFDMKRRELLDSKDLCYIGKLLGKHFTNLKTLFFEHRHDQQRPWPEVSDQLQDQVNKKLQSMEEAIYQLRRLGEVVST